MLERVFTPDWPGLPDHIVALSTVRHGGVSLAPYDDGSGSGGFNLAGHVGDRFEHVLRNRAILDQYLPAQPLWLEQVHGTRVVDAAVMHDDLQADACFTTQTGVVCAVQTADCLPVLLCDAENRVVAAAHAGWRGLVDGVLEKTLGTMLKAGAKLECISVWLGPAIGPDKFEVGAEVRQQFVDADSCADAAFRVSHSAADKHFADIYELARLRLQRAGIVQISGGNFCTVTDKEDFYSYRRDRTTGRMASLIWIKA